MALINKIEHIKKEKLTPERVTKDDSKKSSSEILSELFGVFNAAPPKLEDLSVKEKKSKKSKKKHKKEKKKRNHSCSSDSDDIDHKHKKRKKAKSKKHRSCDSVTPPRSLTPPKSPPRKSKIKVELEHIKTADIKIKTEPTHRHVKEECGFYVPNNNTVNTNDSATSLIPMPEVPNNKIEIINTSKGENKKSEINVGENEKCKGRIQIKNLKFSTVFEETVKKAEEEARRKKEKLEEGEYSDSSSSCEHNQDCNSQFPKTSDPSGILRQQAAEEVKLVEEEKNTSKKIQKSENSHKSSRNKRDIDRSRSHKRSRRSRSSSRRGHLRSRSKTRHRSGSKSVHRASSKSRNRSRSRRRSRSRSRQRPRHSPKHRGRRSSRSPSGVKLADSEKKRLLEVARRNAINMLKNGAVPAGAAALPPHTRNQVMAAIQSGGKSVDELTDFCKNLSKKEALGELSSVSSNDGSDNEDTLAFHHPFLVKEKAPIVMNIRGGAPLPVKSAPLAIVDKDELRMQFPVSSGSQHREKASEWVPVSPQPKDMQIAKIDNKSQAKSSSKEKRDRSSLPALPAPPKSPPPQAKTSTELAIIPALPAPGPQAYPPGIQPPPDIGSIVTEKLLAIRKEQEELESTTHGFGWTAQDPGLGQFTGTTGAQILTPRQLASGTQAWAKKDQLVRATPVEGGMGMHLLQKMGWTPGQGLGKEGTGTLQPLLLEVKLDTRGLQAKEEVRNIRSHRGQGRRAGGGGALVAGGKHPVSLLGEYCSKQKLGPPEYSLCFECGPDHKKTFLFRVKVAGVEYQPAVASANKKQAKADAAQLALQKIGILT